MDMTIKVDLGEGPFEVKPVPFTLVLWERKFKRKASELATAIGAEDIMFLAFEASKQAGITVPAVFDDFCRRLVDVPEILEAEPAVPTDGGVSGGH